MWHATSRLPAASAFERRFKALADGLQHLDAGVELVVGFHQSPWCDRGGRGAVHHVAHRLFVGFPFLAVAPILGSNLEALERGLLAFPETAVMPVPAEWQPKLEPEHGLVLAPAV